MAASPTITVVYFEAGGGHRAAMQALSSVIASLRPGWRLNTLNLQELCEALDPIRRLTGVRIQDRYNQAVERGWTLGTPAALKFLHGLTRLYHRRIVNLLCAHWLASPADIVLSVIPNFNRQLAQSVRKSLPNAAFVTLITDIADYPPHFWIERESQYLICGTEECARQAIAAGHKPPYIMRVSGMVLDPRFHERINVDRDAERVQLGLDPQLPTALVQFGGQGSRAITTVAESLEQARTPLQAIFICGKNRAVEHVLRAREWKIRARVEGFTRQMPLYMRLADFMIGKPGPASISEAIHLGLPVIVACNRWTVPQERFNGQWLRQNGLGIVMRSYRETHLAADRLIGGLSHYRAALGKMNNQAVFEVVECLTRILDRETRPAHVTPQAPLQQILMRH